MQEVKVFHAALIPLPMLDMITLNGNLAQSSLTSWSPLSLLSFVSTFLFTDFPLCPDWELRQTIDPMQGARNLLSNKSSFAKKNSNWGSYAPFSRHCNPPRADFSTCISDVWDIAPPVVLQLYQSWMRWTEDLMEILSIQLSCIVNLWTCAQNWWGLATSVLETLNMLMMVFKILGTVSLLIIWVSCPAWLVKFGASPDMCCFRVMSLTRKARSRFAIICKHMQHNHILN